MMLSNTAQPSEGILKFSADSLLHRRVRSHLDRLLWRVSIGTPPVCLRLIEISISLILLLVSLPLLGVLYLTAKSLGGGIRRIVRVGENAREFQELFFSFNGAFASRTGAGGTLLRGVKRLPALVNVIQGNMSLVGPRTLSRREITFSDRPVWKRFGVRPGLIGLWWIRKRANIAYERESVVDAEYADCRGLRTDLGILLRSVPAAFYGETANRAAGRIDMLGIPIHNVSMAEAIDEITGRVRGTGTSQVCFVNADCLNIARRDADYAQLLRSSALVLADGIGIKLAGNLMQTPIRQNVNGTDLLPRLCERLAEQDGSVYLLGGLPGVAEAVRDWMVKTYPGMRVGGCRHGYFAPEAVSQVVDDIRASGAKVLLVAMGAPRQEKWIRDHAAAAGVPVAIGVGGLFDFYAGRIPRAPQWVREIGMEWLFRFYQEPGRMWKRYLLGNAVFAARILAARLRFGLPGETLPFGRNNPPC